MRTRVRYQGETLDIGEFAYDLRDFHRVVVISMGKAAAPMWDALRRELEPALQRAQPIEAIVVEAACLLRRSLPGFFSDQRRGVGDDREGYR